MTRLGLLRFFEKYRSFSLQLERVKLLRFSSVQFWLARGLPDPGHGSGLGAGGGGGARHAPRAEILAAAELTGAGLAAQRRGSVLRDHGARRQEVGGEAGGRGRGGGLAVVLLTRARHLLEYFVLLDLLHKVLLLPRRVGHLVEHEPAAVLAELRELVLDGGGLLVPGPARIISLSIQKLAEKA